MPFICMALLAVLLCIQQLDSKNGVYIRIKNCGFFVVVFCLFAFKDSKYMSSESNHYTALLVFGP